MPKAKKPKRARSKIVDMRDRAKKSLKKKTPRGLINRNQRRMLDKVDF